MGKNRKLSFLILIISLTGCVQIPKDILKLGPESLKYRQLQTRSYDTKDEVKIITASVEVLQDLGFTIDESEKKLGIITASKDRSAKDAGQIALATVATALAALGGSSSNYYAMCDKEQKMRACLVTKLSEDGTKTNVRLTFQRMVWNMQGNLSRIETIKDETLYQGFFEKLSKSIFLEEHKI